MGDMPLMTANGTFIVNGTERVIVSQMHRSPGVFFDHDKGKTHSSGKYLFAARVIPYRGSWLDFEFDAKDLVYVRIDRRRKLPATTLLLALWDAAGQAKIDKGSELLSERRVGGMSAEEILELLLRQVVFQPRQKRLEDAVRSGAHARHKADRDLIDAKTGKVVAEAGTKMTPRAARKSCRGRPERDAGRAGRARRPLRRRRHRQREDRRNLHRSRRRDDAGHDRAARTAGVKELPTLGIDHVNVGPYMRNTLAADKNASREEALIDIYRVMRPGEPPTTDTAEALFQGLFFDPERYDLSAVGRVKMNSRLETARPRTPCACCARRTSSPSSRSWSSSRTAAARSTTSTISATGASARSAS